MDKQITTRAEDYSQWYLDVIDAAELAEHSPVKGCMVIKPYGYAIWETTQKILDEKFKATDVENAYFPLFIPERLLKREEAHVEGFAPEVAMVTHAGGKKLEEPLVVRPTSETLMYEVFSTWIHSYRDLPLLINQWANVVRWEMRTRLFLRTTEFLWQEGHTVHATDEEADARARQMQEVYRDFAENYMAIPAILGVKSESEKFAGAACTYSLEAMMQDGKALQFATSHNLGQNFAKVFNVKFLDQNSTEQFGWQTSWGLSTRSIGGLIMTHSDDKGLVMPPRIASIQAIITTIAPNPEAAATVGAAANELSAKLKSAGIKSRVDARELRPGEKFFAWEKKGVPVRVELGPKDVAAGTCILVRRDTGEKKVVAIDTVAAEISALLEEIQKNLFDRALEYQKAKTISVDSWEDFVAAIEAGKFVHAHWCGDAAVEAEIKTETGATIRCIPFSSKEEAGVCVKSGKPSNKRVLFAKSY
ncbi:MAG: proline--tRNA ligase [Candidatus Magasanikbacteria bacterium]|nr:proline--tRNA ligase [Candidatus Magasanikbacteria bacterium]